MKNHVLQYTIGSLEPFFLLILPGRTTARTAAALLLVRFGGFAMRWIVVIGGQAFPLSFSGHVQYQHPRHPAQSGDTREGALGALTALATGFVLFRMINKFGPARGRDIDTG